MPDRNNPRISVNQLAKYMTSTPSQRKALIIAQKKPKTFLVNWYDFASKAIVRFIASECEDEDSLVAELERLVGVEPKSEYEERRFRTNAEAIDSFLTSWDRLEIEGLAPSAGPNDPPKLELSAVDVSVRPDIIMRGEYRGKSVVGAVKLYFSKDDVLTESGSAYITTVLYQHLARTGESDGQVSAKFCQVFDVFAGTTASAPKAMTRRLSDVQAACEEISLRWPSA